MNCPKASLNAQPLGKKRTLVKPLPMLLHTDKYAAHLSLQFSTYQFFFKSVSQQGALPPIFVYIDIDIGITPFRILVLPSKFPNGLLVLDSSRSIS